MIVVNAFALTVDDREIGIDFTEPLALSSPVSATNCGKTNARWVALRPINRATKGF
jgi:hypothetical protein